MFYRAAIVYESGKKLGIRRFAAQRDQEGELTPAS
jgi:hypothetical protein